MVVTFRMLGLPIMAILFLCLLATCNQPSNDSDKKIQHAAIDSANWVVENSINYHGGGFENTTVTFTFRQKQYKMISANNEIIMVRSFEKNDSTYVDSTANESVYRFVNGGRVNLDEKKSKAIANSINSVFYFALLPSKLSDPAVISEYKGLVNLGAAQYHKIAVKFKQEGGGEDYQDLFFYWFDASTFQLNFLAYSYATNGGGIRFRSVERQQILSNGYIFQDYVNYKTDSIQTELKDLLKLFRNGELTELSRIRLEKINVVRDNR